MLRMLFVLVLIAAPSQALALKKDAVDKVPLPVFRYEKPPRDEKFAQYFMELPPAFDFYKDILKRDSERLRTKRGTLR